jgi:protoporphyrinogen/coproporphyrinogen III oxidase
MSAPTPTPAFIEIAVIGAGLTGLTIAHAAHAAGRSVCVLERSPRIGGAIETVRDSGFLCESGPNSMLIKSPEVEAFIRSTAAGDQLVDCAAGASKRFIVRDDTVCTVPASPWAGVGSRLFSLRAKLRILREPWISRPPLADESVASFVSRRLGREFLDFAIGPMVSGVFAGDADQLSIRHAFPKVWRLEDQYGSLIRGAIALMRARRTSHTPPFKSRLVSFRDGLEVLPHSLAAPLGTALHTNAQLTAARRTADGWHLEWTDGAGVSQALACRHLVVTVPFDKLPDLPFEPELRTALAGLPAVPHPPVTTVVTGFARDQVAHPLDGFGMLLSPAQPRFILGSIFSSSLFPARAPDGMVSLMSFVGGARQPDNACLDAATIIERTCADLQTLLGVRGAPRFTRVVHWPRAIPQYIVGHGALIDGLDQIGRAWPGLYLQGNYRGGPGLNDCIASGIHTAQRLIGS